MKDETDLKRRRIWDRILLTGILVLQVAILVCLVRPTVEHAQSRHQPEPVLDVHGEVSTSAPYSRFIRSM